MVKDAKELTKVGKAGAVSLAEKRFSFSRISNRISRKIAAGTLAAALLLSPSSALAQDKNPAKTEPPKIEAKAPENKPVSIAQNVSNADKQDERVSNGSSPQDNTFYPDFSDVDLSTLEIYPVRDLEKEIKEADKLRPVYGGFTLVYRAETNDGMDYCVDSNHFGFPNNMGGIIAHAAYGFSSKDAFKKVYEFNKVFIRLLLDEHNKVILSSEIDLGSFAAIFKQVAGKEFKWFRVVSVAGYDNEVGDYVVSKIVPLMGPPDISTIVVPNAPFMMAAYFQGHFHDPVLGMTGK